MRGYTRRSIIVAGFGVVLMGRPASGVLALAAEGSTAASAALLSGAVTGTLAGNSGGAFAYFQFPYLGDGSTVKLALIAAPVLPLENGAFGFNVYFAGALAGSAARSSSANNMALVAFSSATAGPVLVQVFNYDPTTTVAYTLTPTGLPVMAGRSTTTTTAAPVPPAAAATATPVPLPAASTSAGQPIVAVGGAVSGTLPGNSGGAFAHYILNYPGNNKKVTITLSVSPYFSMQAYGSAGLIVYHPRGYQATNTQATGPGVVTAVLSDYTAGPFTLLVFNYDPAVSITYTLVVAAA